MFLRTVSLIFALFFAAAAHGLPQQEAPDVSVSFDQWVAEGNRKDIPWKIHVGPAELGYDQRLELAIRVEVTSKDLSRLGKGHDLFLMARIRDEHGHTIEQGWLANKVDGSLPKKSSVLFRLSFFIVPGTYNVAAVLFDRLSGRYSVHQEPVHIASLKNDPLPRAFSTLPRAQLLPQARGLDSLRNAGVQSRLSLPVASRRPLHFEILLVLGSMEQRSLKSGSPNSSFGFAVSALHVLSQLGVADARFHLTAVDPLRQQIIFEQTSGRELDWSGLGAAVAKLNPDVISAQALESQDQRASYLRNVLVGRIRERPAPVAGQEPVKLFLALGSPLFFPKNVEGAAIAPEDIANLLFFQFRYWGFDLQGSRRRLTPSSISQIARSSMLPQDLEQALKAANPVTFNIFVPQHLREALAKMIAAIEKYPGGAAAAGNALPRL